MKLLLLFLFPSYLFCQIQASNSYCTFGDNSGVCISFEEENRFKYYSMGCFGIYQGEGDYQINQDDLILRFDSLEKEKQVAVVDSMPVQNSYAIIYITTYDDSNKLLPFVNVTLKAKSATDSLEKTFTATSNIDGQIHLEIAADLYDLKLSLRYGETKSSSWSLAGGHDYQLKVKMKTAFFDKIDGEQMKFKVIKNRKKKLKLEMKGDDIEYIQEFKKVDEVVVQVQI